MRILITGGSGFLGKHVVAVAKNTKDIEYLAPTRDVLDLTRPSPGDPTSYLMALTEKDPIDAVIHCAAKAGGIGANKKYPADFCRENLLMATNLLEACRQSGISKVVLIGSVCSYPTNARIPFQVSDLWEGYPDEINAPYGIAKRTQIVLSVAYAKQYSMFPANLILSNLYGPGDNFDLEDGHVIPSLIRRFVEATVRNAPVVWLWGTGNATREFLFVRDAAEAIVRATQVHVPSHPINVGTGIEIPISKIAIAIAEEVGYRGSIVWDPSKPDGAFRRCSDVSSAQAILKWRARTSLKEGIRDTIRYYREVVCRS